MGVSECRLSRTMAGKRFLDGFFWKNLTCVLFSMTCVLQPLRVDLTTTRSVLWRCSSWRWIAQCSRRPVDDQRLCTSWTTLDLARGGNGANSSAMCCCCCTWQKRGGPLGCFSSSLIPFFSEVLPARTAGRNWRETCLSRIGVVRAMQPRYSLDPLVGGGFARLLNLALPGLCEAGQCFAQ